MWQCQKLQKKFSLNKETNWKNSHTQQRVVFLYNEFLQITIEKGPSKRESRDYKQTITKNRND